MFAASTTSRLGQAARRAAGAVGALLGRTLAAVGRAEAILLRPGASGFGHVSFVAGSDGDLIPQTIVATYQPLRGESNDQFIARLVAAGAWQDGEHVEMVYNHGQLQLIKVRHLPAIDCPVAPVAAGALGTMEIGASRT